MKKTITFHIHSYLNRIDWKLLVFLILLINVKLYIKLIALLFIFILRPGFKMLFHPNRLRIPLFYVAIIAFSVLQLLVWPSHLDNKYLPVLFSAIGFWCISFLVLHQLRLAVDINETEKLHRTVLVFFILNAIFSIGNIFIIMIESGSLNPYRFQGLYQKYFIRTGDLIYGISFDTSTTNAIINAFGVIYFLFRKNIFLTGLCILCLLLTTSNIINLLLAVTLLFIFIFYRNKILKSLAIICLAIMICFVARISPENNKYMIKFYNHMITIRKNPVRLAKNPGTLPTEDDGKKIIAQQYLDSVAIVNKANKKKKKYNASAWENFKLSNIVKRPNIHSPPYQRKRDTSANRELLIGQTWFLYKDSALFKILPEYERLPGKLIAFRQSLELLKSDWRYMIFGSGPGNFSSKLSFRTSGMTTFAGSFPVKYIYMDPLFKSNHLRTYLYYATKDDEKHSILNFPNSVYNQLIGEYGLMGFLLFFFLYLGYFIRHHKILSYGFPLLIFMIAVFALDYWFEQLSIVILFELLMLLDMKKLSKNEKS